MSYPHHFAARGWVAATAETLFERLDDPLHLASHMQRRSMAMMGSTMRVDTDAQHGRALGSLIRMRGRVLGLALTLDEMVVERDPPRRKAWQTIGEPHLLAMGAYRMGFVIDPAPRGAQLTVFIDYQLPASAPWRWLGRLLAPMYARWCCNRMLQDAHAAFAAEKEETLAR